MTDLINKLFTPSQADAIKKILKDKEDEKTHFLIEKEIAKTLVENYEFIIEMPLSQIMFLTTLSSFASSEKECHEVAKIIYWGIKQSDILPMISKHTGANLAYRCLISLSFFKQYMNKLCNRYGAPSLAFYRDMGIKSFYIIGQDNIGNHFYKWECFISEIFAN